MRIKPTLLLLVVAVLAAAYFFLVEQPRHERDNEKTQNASRLIETFPDAVDRINVSRQDVEISFDRHQGHWRLTSPLVDRADDSSVNTMLYSIAQAAVEKRIEAAPIEHADFGLDPPGADVTIEGTSSGAPVRVRVLIGDFSLTKSHCYARVEGTDDVFLVHAGIRRYAMRSLFEFRDKRITDVPVEQIHRILVASPDGSMDWRKHDSRDWITVVHGDSVRGDSSAVEGIVRELRGLRARNILTTIRPEANDLFSEPEGSVSMWMNDSDSPLVIEFGNKKNDRCHVSNSANERVALVDTTVLRVFRRTLEDLRNKRLLDFDPARAAKLTVDTTNRSMTIINRDSEWTFANPEFGTVDQARTVRFLDTLRSLKFTDVIEERLVDGEAYGFYKPSFELTVFDRNDLPIDRVSVGSELSGSRLLYVTSLSTGVLARVDEALIDRLTDDFLALGNE